MIHFHMIKFVEPLAFRLKNRTNNLKQPGVFKYFTFPAGTDSRQYKGVIQAPDNHGSRGSIWPQ